MLKEEEQWKRLEFFLRQIDFFLEQNTRRYLVSKGLTRPRFLLLAEVCSNPGLSLTELHEKMDVTLSTVSSLTDQLVIGGLLSRERRSDDRRIIQLELTQEGNSLLEDVMKYRYGLIRNVLEKMSPEQVSSLIMIIKEFVAYI